MEFLKTFFNFKENKGYKITILVLIFMILLIQTSLSITNKKIRYANIKISSLNDELKNSEGNIAIVETTDSLYKKEATNITDNITSANSELVERYTAIGKEINKTYDSSIKDGNKILVFETLDLNNITDNQIKSGLSNFKKATFGFEICTKMIQDKKFYKIILIE